MAEFEETYDKWRKTLLRDNIYFGIVVFAVELFMFLLLINSNLMMQSVMVYLLNFLFVPTVADIFILVAGNILIKKVSPSSKIINYIPSVQLACICFVVSEVHFMYSVTLCVFCVPLFTTIIFNNKKMTRNVGILCCIFLMLVLTHRKYSPYRLINDSFFYQEAIVAFVILIATIGICNVLIKYQEEKNNIIHRDFLIKLQMQDQLKKDPKTGLNGYSFFVNTLDQMVELAENTSQLIALAIIDIDNFKQINDTYGHLKGDRVIMTLSELMQLEYTHNCFLARYGGEEFAIIFSEDKVNSAYESLKKLGTDFEKQKYNFTHNPITISIGLAIWKSGWTSEQLFNNADVAMYTSKEKGKNTITIFN